jgi:hypothetical protein
MKQCYRGACQLCKDDSLLYGKCRRTGKISRNEDFLFHNGKFGMGGVPNIRKKLRTLTSDDLRHRNEELSSFQRCTTVNKNAENGIDINEGFIPK